MYEKIVNSKHKPNTYCVLFTSRDLGPFYRRPNIPTRNTFLPITFSLYCPAVNKILIGGQEYWHTLC